MRRIVFVLALLLAVPAAATDHIALFYRPLEAADADALAAVVQEGYDGVNTASKYIELTTSNKQLIIDSLNRMKADFDTAIAAEAAGGSTAMDKGARQWSTLHMTRITEDIVSKWQNFVQQAPADTGFYMALLLDVNTTKPPSQLLAERALLEARPDILKVMAAP